MADPKTQSLRRRLLAWYRRERRDLPWRNTRDAYRVWVSEIMLQQTRVDVVVPYWERFLEAFPDVHALAEADEQEVLARWSGLGYYRRARMLHRAAGEIVREHDGHFPDDPAAARALPGVGRYTAGAVLSIAYGREEPVLDGNVVRVLCRLHGLDGRPDRQPLAGELWRRAEELVRGASPGELNQALMELGATLCTPSRTPDCPRCPLRSDCVAHAQDRIDELPNPVRRKAPREETWTVALCRRRGRTLLRQRVGETLLSDLWELPSAVVAPHPRGEAEAALSEVLGAPLRLGEELCRLERGISGRKVRMHVHDAQLEESAGPHARWLTLHQAAEKALTTPTRLLLGRWAAPASRRKAP